MRVPVEIEFQTSADRQFLIHDGAFVQVGQGGNAMIQVEENEFDLLLFGVQGAPGITATITLTPPSSHHLEISGHPIQIRIAQGKTRSGDSRFFRIRS